MKRPEAEILVDNLVSASFLYEHEDLPRSKSKCRKGYIAAKEAVIAALVEAEREVP